MQKSVTADTDINEGRLDGRLYIDNPAFVDITQVFLFRRTLVIELVQPAILKNPDTDLLRLNRIDQDLPDNGRFLTLGPFPGPGLLLLRWFLIGVIRLPSPAPAPAAAGFLLLGGALAASPAPASASTRAPAPRRVGLGL